MSAQIDALIARARASEADTETGGAPRSADRQRLERLAAEFESMLMGQMLRDMRRAGRWDDGEKTEDSLGAQSLFEMLDAELAAAMSKAQGLGLTKQMMDAFDRMQGKGTQEPASPDAVGALTRGLGSPAAGARPSFGLVTGTGPIAALTAADVTSGFGWRRDPITGNPRFHQGVDLRAAYGQDVPASGGGRVVFSGEQGSYGTTVLLEHANGTQTRYAHLSVALVSTGDAVDPGQLIGRAGASGRATGPHIHLEMLDSEGKPRDPLLD